MPGAARLFRGPALLHSRERSVGAHVGVGALLAGLLAALAIAPGHAQLADVRPGDERTELPAYQEEPSGPLVDTGLLDLPHVPDFTPLAYYRSERAENGSPPGLMMGTPAISAGDFGRGRVMSISPHPEQTAGLEPMVRRAIFWAAGR